MNTNKGDISHLIKLLEAIYHELKVSCPDHYSSNILACKLCEYSEYCQWECEHETIQD